MKIGILAGNNSNLYASAMIQTLMRAGYSIQLAVVMDFRFYAQAIRRLRKVTFKKLMQRFIDRKTGKCEESNPYLNDYIYRIELSFDSIMNLSVRNHFDILYSEDINNSATVASIKKSNIDVLIYCSGGILRRPLINTPKIGVLNAHMGILPKYRGMNVLEWSLFYDDPIGVTIHFIDEGIDTGAILITEKLGIEKGNTIEELRQKSIVLNLKLMKDAIDLIHEGKCEKIPNPMQNGKQYFVMHDSLKKLVELKLMKI
jgi:folate-dependent phosphoribosylglycinamide formyltransferase PurN